MTTLTETAPSVSSVERTSPAWRRALFGFLLTIAGAVVLAAAFVFGLTRLHDGKVMPGVTIAGVSLAGLDRTEAEARLREELPSMSAGSLVLVSGDTTRRVRYAEIGRDYDLTAALDAAFAVGRTGTLSEQLTESLWTLVDGTPIALDVRFDERRLAAAIDRAVAGAERDAVDAKVSLGADGRTFAISRSVDGVAVDRAEAKFDATTAMAAAGSRDATVALVTKPVKPSFTTAEARAAVAAARRQADAITRGGIVLTNADGRFRIEESVVRRWVSFETRDGRTWSPVLVGGHAAKAVKGIAARVDRDARDASLAFRGSNTMRVIPSQAGRRVDVRQTAAKVEKALMARLAGGGAGQLALVVRTTEPSYTTAMAQAAAKRVRRISTWTTNYVPSEKNFWGNNISRPTEKIDGYVVGPGEWFDFWEVVGSLRELGGVGPGGFINNGRTDPTGAFGGGICSCSTTIFNAAIRAGLEAGARKAHYYYITRYPLGLDATVARSESFVTTMSFRNDTPHPILIRGINSPGAVRFDIYGVPNGRKVTFTEPQVWNYSQAGDSIEYTDDLPPGARERVESPIDGMDVSVTRYVRDANGKLIHKDTWVSHYGTVTGVTEVGVPDGSPLVGKTVSVP